MTLNISVVIVFAAYLPNAHVSSRGSKGFAEELANLVGVCSDLR